ncbi:uncharacterized protein LOC119775806 [Cyprinodon tularosa]|uniref:uncharacterized protein LOC119775806 n=1 Tax=Cyprinodon tularosa TaxID=77115 RepID=UPI0018E2743D|nr:uncharacterized protein LOC119775806 [Cyprinodon tularosa]
MLQDVLSLISSINMNFSLMDLDMLDSRSDFATQSSAWCGLESVSGSGSLYKSSSRADGFIHPGLRRWQSIYHLESESPRRFSPLKTDLWAGRNERSFRPAEGRPWLQDAHERLHTKQDWMRSNRRMAQMLDIEQMLLSKSMSGVGQDAGELQQLDWSRHHGDLKERALKLENELQHMRSNFENVSEDHWTRLPAPALHSESLKTPGDVQKQEKSNLAAEVGFLRKALREAEAKATTLQEERDKAVKDLQTSVEVKENMKQELEVIMKHLASTQLQQQELNEERIRTSRQITDPEEKRSKLIRKKKELLSKKNQSGCTALNETNKSNLPHR